MNPPNRPMKRLALSLAAAACISTTAQAQALAPNADAMRPPAAVTDLRSAITQTAAVIEGTVAEIRHEYSDAEGPWTLVVLRDVKSHLGQAPAELTLRHFGGPLPNGRHLVATELPVFVADQRYVVFLRNTAWNLSPVVADYALRVARFEGTEVLVNTDGLALTGVGPMGLLFGEALFEGPQLDGRAPRARPDRRLAALQRAPLDRSGLLQRLGSELGSRGLAVGGRFNERPAGQFRWKAMPTVAAAGGEAEAARTASRAGTGTEIDASRPATR